MHVWESFPDEQQMLENWYASFDDKKGLLEQLDDSQKANIATRILSGIHSSLEIEDPKEKEAPSFFRRHRVLLVACSVILVVMSWYLPGYINNKETIPTSNIKWVEIKGAAGKLTRDTLPDGSIISLNGIGKIRFDRNFLKNVREVWLEGEGYFDVVRQPQRPFRVYAGNLSASVLGTEFNIKRSERDGQVTVTVTEGRVSVEASQKVLGVLGVNDQILYNSITGKFSQKKVEAASAVAWTKTGFVFKDKPFKEIAGELEKKFGIHVKFVNSGLQNCLLTASFDPDVQAKDILNMLCKTNGSQLVINKDIFTISGRPCKN